MGLALVGVAGAELEPAWAGAGVPSEAAIRGFEGVTLMLDDAAPTGAILTDVLGFREAARDGALIRYAADAALGGTVDIRVAAGFLPGRAGGGSVHHVAFRAAGDAEQAEMVRRLAENHGLHTTEQKDRNYFRSVYFREPGGILFEIATDDPGFPADEPVDRLGEALKLPAFLEPRRPQIEAVLPDLV
jgi:glyoxalase family protein